MTVFTTEHVARKQHVCSDCRGPIKPGQRYKVHVATPRDPELGNTRWWRIRSHLTNKECEYR